MRRPFTTSQAIDNGLTKDALKWAVRKGTVQRVFQGIYIKGTDPVTTLEEALALVLRTGGVASHSLAGLLHDLEGVQFSEPFVTLAGRPSARRSGVCVHRLPTAAITTVRGYSCTSGTQTVLDLAKRMDDLTWEQALESALRKNLTTIADIHSALPALGQARTPGTAGIRRVLKLRPPSAPESLLETFMVQLIRADPRLPEPQRQVEVFDRHGLFVARVDLAWPDRNVFIELDGQQHKEQPAYDARRETAVVAATGWLPGRFTWTELTRAPRSTASRLVEILDAATRQVPRGTPSWLGLGATKGA